MVRNHSSISRDLASVTFSPAFTLAAFGRTSNSDPCGKRGYSMPSTIRRSREAPPSSAARAS